jgi:hypothetical protein
MGTVSMIVLATFYQMKALKSSSLAVSVPSVQAQLSSWLAIKATDMTVYQRSRLPLYRMLRSLLEQPITHELPFQESRIPIGPPFHMIAEPSWGCMGLRANSRKSYRVIPVT